MVQIVAKDNLGQSFEFDEVAKKINVKTDDLTIGKNSSGALELKAQSMAFINAVRSAETKTSLTSRVDSLTGNRIITFTDEDGASNEINLSSFLSDVSIAGGTLDGQVLRLTNEDSEIVIDLGVFITEDELTTAINNAFNHMAVDAFGTQLFKVRGL